MEELKLNCIKCHICNQRLYLVYQSKYFKEKTYECQNGHARIETIADKIVSYTVFLIKNQDKYKITSISPSEETDKNDPFCFSRDAETLLYNNKTIVSKVNLYFPLSIENNIILENGVDSLIIKLKRLSPFV